MLLVNTKQVRPNTPAYPKTRLKTVAQQPKTPFVSTLLLSHWIHVLSPDLLSLLTDFSTYSNSGTKIASRLLSFRILGHSSWHTLQLVLLAYCILIEF